jgi:transposase
MASWIGSHVRAFEYFGGVPEKVVPDNLKSGVKDPCRYEPPDFVNGTPKSAFLNDVVKQLLIGIHF